MAPGWYVSEEADPLRLDQRIVEAMAGMPEDAAVTGWAALGWLRPRWFGGLAPDGRTPRPVPIAVGDVNDASKRPGIRLSEDWLFDDDVITVDGLRITIPNRSVTFETRRARTLRRAVPIIDMAAYEDLVDLEGLQAYAARLLARPGIRLTRRALLRARENTWSPREPLLRMTWEDGVPGVALLCNPPIFDTAGRHLFTPDVFDPVAAVAGEYNGQVHDDGPSRRRDLDKEAAYRHHGIEYVGMMSLDLPDLRNFEARLHAAYDRAGRQPPTPTWTLDQPDWWVDTSTVALRRALTEEQRRIWLRRRS